MFFVTYCKFGIGVAFNSDGSSQTQILKFNMCASENIEEIKVYLVQLGRTIMNSLISPERC
ncbi:hypothetical protein NIES4074_28740 [Cylindrospermum sp. NIES-4074]|jgi:hypothetical protein|nr:hypothetical protein NIES4074_28740 [Cylindrospermum sp. NIES-4074]